MDKDELSPEESLVPVGGGEAISFVDMRVVRADGSASPQPQGRRKGVKFTKCRREEPTDAERRAACAARERCGLMQELCEGEGGFVRALGEILGLARQQLAFERGGGGGGLDAARAAPTRHVPHTIS